MRIGIDARSIGERVCGVSRTTLKIVAALSENDKANEYFVFTNVVLPAELLGSNFEVIRTDYSRMNPLADFRFSRLVSSFKLDVFHSIHSWLPLGIGLSRAKKIVTIHDVFAITDRNFFAKYGFFSSLARLYFLALISRSAKIADRIVTISNYSSGKICEVFPFAAEKLRTIYLASGLTADAVATGVGTQRERYMLFVGNCRSYKNIPTLIEGFSIYTKRKEGTDLKLVIAGNDACDEARALAVKLGISPGVKFLSAPDDKYLRQLYQKAIAFIMPSREEGFGIPVLEAMSCGVPVIVSDAGALTEIAGGATLVFEKDSPEQLADLIDRVEQDEPLRQDLSARGLARSSEFSWKRTASEFINCYKTL